MTSSATDTAARPQAGAVTSRARPDHGVQRRVQDESPENTLRDGKGERNQDQRRKRRHRDLEAIERRCASPTGTSRRRRGSAPPTSRRAESPPATGAMNRHGRKQNAVTTAVSAGAAAHADAGDALDVRRARRAAEQAGAERGDGIDDQALAKVLRLAVARRRDCAACATPMNVDSESNRSVIITVIIAGTSDSLQRAPDVELEEHDWRSPAR